MSRLLLKPAGTSGKVHDVTPETAGWGYVGFTLYRLEPGDVAEEATGDEEVILVIVEGKATVQAYDANPGYVGARLTFSYRLPLSERISIVVGGRVENFSGAANAGSPLYRSQWNGTVVAGFAFSLWQSEARVDVSSQPFD